MPKLTLSIKPLRFCLRHCKPRAALILCTIGAQLNRSDLPKWCPPARMLPSVAAPSEMTDAAVRVIGTAELRRQLQKDVHTLAG